jgi:fumarylacetoacetase
MDDRSRADPWVDIPDGSPFPLHNLPFGIARRDDGTIGAFVAIGDHALDLADAVGTGFLDDSPAEYGLLDAGGTLNGFAAAGRVAHAALRERLIELFTERRHQAQLTPCLVPLDELTMQLPVAVGDYVDFYSSLHHATNLGRLFRPDGEALLPNWRHIPVGYHGRSGTIVADGADIARPTGCVSSTANRGTDRRTPSTSSSRSAPSSAHRRSSASRSRPPTPSSICSGCAS